MFCRECSGTGLRIAGLCVRCGGTGRAEDDTKQERQMSEELEIAIQANPIDVIGRHGVVIFRVVDDRIVTAVQWNELEQRLRKIFPGREILILSGIEYVRFVAIEDAE